ncbi:uncharacterized protein BJX67DRAFT_297383 [Aspergillus lucknowensis]|uniref:Uncharacterized protein n=1 Tax=Aspergillus lucknowensis TaxID=176173 RepID=A0ABR4LD04_9EURO
MAPRRGGGGSWDVSGPSCSDDAFETEQSRVYIAFYALFFVAFAILFIVGSSRANRSKQRGRPLVAWSWLALSLLCGLGAQLAAIIDLTLGECDIASQSDLLPALIIWDWLDILSKLILNAVILTSLTKKLQQHFASTPSSVLRLQAAYAVLLVLIALAALGIETAVYVAIYSDDAYDPELADKLFDPQRGVWTTYMTVSVFGLLIASSTMGKILSQGTQHSGPRNLKSWAIALLVAALGYNTATLGGYVTRAFADPEDYATSKADYLAKSAEAVYFLTNFFYAVAVYAAVAVGGPGVYTPGVAPAYVAPVQPPNPGFSNQIPSSRY